MKKIYALILAAVILLAIPTVAFATSGKLDIDLSKLSYDELVELKDQINLAIWQSKEWQEVEVPQGIWEVGKDIPEGKWTIKAYPKTNIFVYIGDELKDSGTDIKYWTMQQVVSPEFSLYKEGRDMVEFEVDLEKGVYVKISLGNAVFSPYSGKPSLGFKK